MSPAGTVLIVEDDAALRPSYRVALTFEGYDVQEARGGFEALRRLESNRPDLVILDLSLPGVDGFTVRQELAAHAHTRHIPIVIVTGSQENLDHMEVACLLRKPVSPDRLIEAVKSCLASGAAGTSRP